MCFLFPACFLIASQAACKCNYFRMSDLHISWAQVVMLRNTTGDIPGSIASTPITNCQQKLKILIWFWDNLRVHFEHHHLPVLPKKKQGRLGKFVNWDPQTGTQCNRRGIPWDFSSGVPRVFCQSFWLNILTTKSRSIWKSKWRCCVVPNGGEKRLNVCFLPLHHCTFSCSQNSLKKLSYLPHVGKKLMEIGLHNLISWSSVHWWLDRFD